MAAETIYVAVIVAVPPTLASVAALISSLKNGRKSDAIKVQTNSHLNDLIHKLDLADQRIAGLEQRLIQMAEARTATATAQAVTDAKVADASQRRDDR